MEEKEIKEAMARLKGLVQEFAVNYKAKQKLAEELEEVNGSLKAQEGKLIEILKECNLESFKCEHGTISVWDKASYTTPKEHADREAFFGYLKEKGIFDTMVTVNYNTLNGWAEKEYEAAKERGDMTFSIPGLAAPTLTPMLSKTRLTP